MKNVDRVARGFKSVGEPSSKYGYDYDGSQFEADMKAHLERGEFLWNEFVEFMRSHNATPEDFRGLFRRYYDEFIGGAP